MQQQDSAAAMTACQQRPNRSQVALRTSLGETLSPPCSAKRPGFVWKQQLPRLSFWQANTRRG